MHEQAIRVRFAPSPTGHLHIGGLRTAIFNWLFARHNNGTFLVRIEDTDRERFKQEYVDSIIASLQWSGLVSDEPIVIQSERLPEHTALAEQLLAQKKVYRCYCTEAEVLTRHAQKYGPNDAFIKYDGHCRDRAPQDASQSYVIRFALPRDIQQISFDDMIRGTVTFDMDQFDDFIIVRSDGRPVYNFVVVADDAFMNITHVVRGEDHIPNTPKQIFLFNACGYAVPQFAHLPLILGPSGDKLSKRDGAVSAVEYKDKGYLPEALINYLVRLGWSHGDQEKFTQDELIHLFSLDQVGKKGAIFDTDKLNWMNGVYIREKTAQELFDYITNYVAPDFIDRFPAWNEQQILQLLQLYKDRVLLISELIDALTALYTAPQVYTQADVEKWISSGTPAHLHEFVQIVEKLPTYTVDSITDAVKTWCKSQGISLAHIAQPLRIALVGKTASPGIFELVSIIGKQETVSRIQIFLHHIDQ